MLAEIDKNTVDFTSNFDDRLLEPTVLPSGIPNLVVNGSSGIAVGMATNIPPHNMREVIAAVVHLIERPDATPAEIRKHIKGPDFPTGGAILGRAGVRAAYSTGRGSIIMRAKVHTETLRKDREALIVSEIPYQVNKSTLIEKIAELVREKRLEGISDLRDESDRDGMRIVIELKREAVSDVVLNQLWRFTAMQSSFGANMIALNGGRPEMMTLRDMLVAFLDFREEVVARRTKFLLTKARDSAHIQVGLAIAVANIDEVIRLIRTSPDSAAARNALMERVWPARDMAPLIGLIADPRHSIAEDGTIRLSDAQARAILELRLARLTALGRDEIAEALNKLAAEIADYLDILGSRARLMSIIRAELVAVKTAFADKRRTEILESEADMDDEDLIQREDMVVTVTHGGYVKRVPVSAYRAQRRGGKGVIGAEQPGLVILGKQAIDDDCNQTGQMLAALTGWGQGTFASKVVVGEGQVDVTREVDGGMQTVTLKLPAIVTTDLRLNEPRYASLPNIMKAKKKPIDEKTSADFGVDATPRVKVLKTAEPSGRKAGVKVKSVAELVAKLHDEVGVI